MFFLCIINAFINKNKTIELLASLFFLSGSTGYLLNALYRPLEHYLVDHRDFLKKARTLEHLIVRRYGNLHDVQENLDDKDIELSREGSWRIVSNLWEEKENRPRQRAATYSDLMQSTGAIYIGCLVAGFSVLIPLLFFSDLFLIQNYYGTAVVFIFLATLHRWNYYRALRFAQGAVELQLARELDKHYWNTEQKPIKIYVFDREVQTRSGKKDSVNMGILKKMKIEYKIAIGFIILLALITVIAVSKDKLPWLVKSMPVLGIFVAIAASVIALSNADPNRKLINVTIEHSLDKQSKAEYPKNLLSDKLKSKFENSNSLESYRICFELTNKSGITLQKPTLTFRLPIDKQHPNETKKEEKASCLTFNSNIFNSQDDIRYLEFEDTLILSNSNLPYWNDGNSITIWIRMLINSSTSPFNIEVSVNCKNADGVTKVVEINPGQLLASSESVSSSTS